MNTRAVGYVCIRRDEQNDFDLRTDSQCEKLRESAARLNLDLIDIVTGDSPERALERLGAGDALIVVKLDRLTRSVRELAELVKRHFASGERALISIAEGIDTREASVRAAMNVLAALAHFEEPRTFFDAQKTMTEHRF